MNWIKYLKAGSILLTVSTPVISFSSELAVYEISQQCSHKFPKEIEMFEKRNGMRFVDAVNAEASSKNTSFNVGPSQLTGFCVKMMGRDYSVVSFSSKPQGAKIFMDGEEQTGTTDRSFRYPQGTYKYEIKPTHGDVCSGSIKLKKGKKYKISCPK